MIARNLGINWVNYIEYEIIDEKVKILRSFRRHKFDDIDHPETNVNYQFQSTDNRKKFIAKHGGLANLTKEQRREVFQIDPGPSERIGICLGNQFYEIIQ